MPKTKTKNITKKTAAKKQKTKPVLDRTGMLYVRVKNSNSNWIKKFAKSTSQSYSAVADLLLEQLRKNPGKNKWLLQALISKTSAANSAPKTT